MKFALHKIALALGLGLAITAAQAAGSSTGTFNVTINITGTCNAVATNTGQAAVITTASPTTAGADIDFGSVVAATGAAALTSGNKGGATSSITVNCSKNTPFNIALAPTNVASTTGAGTMKGITLPANTDTIPYQLYQPTTTGVGLAASVNNTISASVWGNVIGTNTMAFTGKGLGTAITFPVFATIPAGNLDKFIDRYQDQVTVTLSW